MSFKRVPQTFSGAIKEVTIGTGDKAITIGGENVMPLCAYDAPIANKVRVGLQISDLGFDATLPELAAFYAGCNTVAECAAKAAALPEADFIALELEGSDPNGENKSAEECAEIALSVANAVDCPIVIIGCKNADKNAEVFGKVGEALAGKNVLLMSAKEENYKTIAGSAGLAYKQKISGESAVDINLAKQLNVLISQMGLAPDTFVMNVGSAAAGYGFEYVASTLDRVKGAALSQNDGMLQMPIVTPVGSEAWGVKEAVVSEEDFPEWGSRENRGINMEISTAAACIASGSNAVILKHPESVKTISALVGQIM